MKKIKVTYNPKFNHLNLNEFVQDVDKKFTSNIGQPVIAGDRELIVVTQDKQRYLIKRNNIFKQPRPIRRSLKKSKALHALEMSQYLIQHDVFVPEQYVCIDINVGPFLVKSYGVMQYIDGPNLRKYAENNDLSFSEQQKIIEQLKDYFLAFRRLKFEHGDLHFKNFIYHEEKCILIDFDTSKIHQSDHSYQQRFISHEIPRFEKHLNKLGKALTRANRNTDFVANIRQGLKEAM